MPERAEEQIIYQKLLKLEQEFSAFSYNEMDEYLDSIRKNVYLILKNNQFEYAPIESSKPGIGKLIVKCKKMIRKSIEFVIEPIIKKQADVNVFVGDSMLQMTAMMQDYIIRAKRREDAAAQKMQRLSAEQEQHIAQLQGEIQSLREEICRMQAEERS